MKALDITVLLKETENQGIAVRLKENPAHTIDKIACQNDQLTDRTAHTTDKTARLEGKELDIRRTGRTARRREETGIIEVKHHPRETATTATEIEDIEKEVDTRRTETRDDDLLHQIDTNLRETLVDI